MEANLREGPQGPIRLGGSGAMPLPTAPPLTFLKSRNSKMQSPAISVVFLGLEYECFLHQTSQHFHHNIGPYKILLILPAMMYICYLKILNLLYRGPNGVSRHVSSIQRLFEQGN